MSNEIDYLARLVGAENKLKASTQALRDGCLLQVTEFNLLLNTVRKDRRLLAEARENWMSNLG